MYFLQLCFYVRKAESLISPRSIHRGLTSMYLHGRLLFVTVVTSAISCSLPLGIPVFRCLEQIPELPQCRLRWIRSVFGGHSSFPPACVVQVFLAENTSKRIGARHLLLTMVIISSLIIFHVMEHDRNDDGVGLVGCERCVLKKIAFKALLLPLFIGYFYSEFALKCSVFVHRNLFLFKWEDHGRQDAIVVATHKQMSLFHLVIYLHVLTTPLVSYLYYCVSRQKYLYKYLPLVFSCPLGCHRRRTEWNRTCGATMNRRGNGKSSCHVTHEARHCAFGGLHGTSKPRELFEIVYVIMYMSLPYKAARQMDRKN